MNTNTKPVMVGDTEVALTDQAAEVVTRALKKRERAVAKARRELDAQTAQNAKEATSRKQKLDRLTAEVATKQAQLVTVQKRVDNLPAELQRLVTERLDATTKANAILGEVRDWSPEPTENIRRFVVLSKIGDKGRGWSDAQIKAAFDTLEVPSPHTAARQLRDAFSGGPQYRDRQSVKRDYDDRIGNAWKDNPDGTVH